jgi:thiamine kinase-like enzyme
MQSSTAPLAVTYLRTTSLKSDPRNPRVHSDKQVRQIAQSIESLGFNVPLLIDRRRICGRNNVRQRPHQRLLPRHVPSGTSGNFWRTYRFIESAHTYDAVESTDQAFQTAKTFGRFQKLLADLPAPRLHDTIKDFHHTSKRFVALEQAIASDVVGRAIASKREIEVAFAHQSITSVLIDANLPERITHNDTKFNNVMLDEMTSEGICVIDLDTVMPGLVLHDFGDMIRTATSPAKEDEQDLSKVTLQFSMFEALVSGYLASAGDFLTKTEKQFLVLSGKLMTFEQGLRFLTDYLQGDAYYKVRRGEHNLERCRTQFKLLESIERQEERMDRLGAVYRATVLT